MPQTDRPIAWMGLAAACLLTFPYPLMSLARRVHRLHAPQEAFSWPNNGSFTVIGVLGTETGDECAYAARVRQASDTLIPGDPYAGGSPSLCFLLTDSLSYAPMGLAHRLIGEISVTWIFVRFLCAVFWFVLVFNMVYLATRHREASIMAAAFITFFSYLLAFLFLGPLTASSKHGWEFLKEALWALGSYGRTENVLRLPRPGLTYAALFLSCLALAKAEEKRTWLRATASGLLGGLLIYFRLDVGSTYLGASFLFFLWIYLKERKLPKTLAGSFAISAVLSLPWMLCHFPADREILELVGATFTRTPSWISLFYLLAVVIVWKRETHNPMLLCLGAMLGSLFLICNLQVLTGYDVQKFHWEFIGNIFLFLLAFCLLAPRFPEKHGLGARVFLILGILCFLQGLVFAVRRYPSQGLPADYEEALAWLRTHSPKDSVVASLGTEPTLLIPVYSHNKTFLSYTHPLLSDLPLRENAQRLAYLIGFLDMDRERYIRECILHERESDFKSSDRPAQELEFSSRIYFFFYPRPKAAQLLRETARQQMPKYRIDYLWLGKFESQWAGPSFKTRRKKSMTQVFTNSSVTLYQIMEGN